MLHAGTKVALSLIPLLGGPSAALFDFLVAQPVAKRRDQWIEELGGALQDALDRLGKLEGHERDPELFLTVCLQASAIALKTHEGDKRAALRAAVVNTAIGQSPDDAKAIMFVGWLDQLTEWHLRVLTYLGKTSTPVHRTIVAKFPTNAMAISSASEAFAAAFPELEKRFGEQIVRDLMNRGLLFSDRIDEFASTSLTTVLGREFLAFFSLEE
jgi:hypothetical protein